MSVIRLTISYPRSARNLELANWRVFVAKPRLIRHIAENTGREMVLLCGHNSFRIGCAEAQEHANSSSLALYAYTENISAGDFWLQRDLPMPL